MLFLLMAALAAVSRAQQVPVAERTEITVTASRGSVEPVDSTAQIAVTAGREKIVSRPTSTIGHALDGEPSILVQQSTTAQVSPFLRGLTGYHVVNLVDGVRYNNATFRSGPNQYLVFVEPSQAQRVEALLGPSGSQYGSDSLGGAINVVTPEARFGGTHGDFTLFGSSADLGAGGNAQLSTGRTRWALLGGISGRRSGDLRGGGGLDSRNVFHRLFGMDRRQVRDLLGSRMHGTGFRQYGVNTKLALRPSAAHSVTLWFQRGELDSVNAYKDLLGGLGRVRSTFDPQTLDFFYARYEKVKTGPFDTISGTFSVNSQTDGGTRQGLRASDAVTVETNRVRAYGYSAQASTHAGSRAAVVFGADVFDERVSASRFTAGRAVRPLYPDGVGYNTAGVFGQGSAQMLSSRLRLGLGGRWTRIGYEGRSFRDLTFNSSATLRLAGPVSLHALVSRGFRAPNLNDLSSLGLNDLGYEVPSEETIAAGALIGSSAGETATSLGVPVSRLRAESLYNYEAGIRLKTGRLYARVHAFDAELHDPIVRRTLLFPANALPRELAGLPVTPVAATPAQREQGVAMVATALDPRGVKAFVNDGRSRYRGVESLAQAALSERWSLRASYAFLAGVDLYPNRPIRRLPPQLGSAALRYSAARRYWIEGALSAAGAQRRLSGGDIDDERIGASRRRIDIADFFGGARVSPYLDASGRFLPTGETLRQIQDRVMPGVADTVRLPLYTSTAGWASVSLRAGIPVGERWTVYAAVENLADRNYRLHGSGVDAPGRNAYLALRCLW